jgi:hypothetical protein
MTLEDGKLRRYETSARKKNSIGLVTGNSFQFLETEK